MDIFIYFCGVQVDVFDGLRRREEEKENLLGFPGGESNDQETHLDWE